MPSGKRARQRRQAAATTAPPPVRSKGPGGARPRQASSRALAIAGGVAIIVVLAIVLGFVLTKGSSGGGGPNMPTTADLKGLPATGSQNWPGALQGSQEANDLFKGIPQKGLVLGDPKAPVTMEMFIDVQCPVCDDYEVNHLTSVVQNYIKPGKVQLHLQPWAFLGGQGSQSFSGRLGLIAAAAQNLGFNYAKVLYDNQGTEESGWLTGQTMANIAASTSGLNLQQWQKDTNSSAAQSVANAVDKLATKKKVQGTPTIYVGCTGGQLKAAMPAGSYEPQAVEPALNAAVAACSK